MKRLLVMVAVLVVSSSNAQAVSINFESVAGLTPLNTNVQGTALAANASIVGEIPGLVISSLGPSKDVDLDGDGTNDSMFSGVSWLDFTGTGSTARSGSRVIAGANFDPVNMSDRIVDFGNFVEFRLLSPGTKFFEIFVEFVQPGTVRAIFRDAINGGNALSSVDLTSSGLVNFLSPGADIRNVVFIPIGGAQMWLDDLTYDAGAPNGVIPEPATVLLVGGGAAMAALRRFRARRRRA